MVGRAGCWICPACGYSRSALRTAADPSDDRGYIDSIQCSWVKLGRQGCLKALQAGCNDFGGTLMNESISRAAGANHGQELAPDEMERLIRSIGRRPVQRTTLYQPVKRLDVATA